MAEGLVLLALSDLLALRVKPVPLALLGLRVMPVNADLLDQKAPEVFRDPPDPLVVELEEPRFLALRGLEVLLDLPGRRVIMAFQDLLDPLVPPELMVNQDPRATTVQLDPLVLPDPRAPLDLLVRTQ